MTSSFAVSHPSEPNYMALFAGSTFGLTSDTCPVSEGTTANLGSELLAAGYTFKGYSEGLPKTGSTSLHLGRVRPQALAVDQLQQRAHLGLGCPSPLPELLELREPADVSFVIPNLDDDMHDGTISQADTWLNNNLSAYATWAKTNNSLLIVTWDEDDYSENNQIPTIFYGADVTTGHVRRERQPLQRARDAGDDVRPERGRQQLRRHHDQRHLGLSESQ